MLSLAGIPLLLVSVVWVYSVFAFDRSMNIPPVVHTFFLILGAGLFLVGCFLFAGHYLLFYLEAPLVNYVVTSRRVIIRRGVIFKREFEIFVDGIVGLKVFTHGGKDEAGTIQFIASATSAGAPFYLKRFPTEQFRGEVRYAIESVPNVHAVRISIEKAIDKRKNANALLY